MESIIAPFYNALDGLNSKEIHSFHALPLNFGHILPSLYFKNEFKKFYTTDFLSFETTVTESWLDNPLSPKGPLYLAEKCTSEVFGVDKSFFITSGTSVANQIVLDAILENGDNILVERNVHKSIHFSLSNFNLNICYVEPQYSDANSERTYSNFEKMIQDFSTAFDNNQPFKVVILNASTYEGVINDIPLIINKLAEINPNFTILIDEAWFAFAKFNDVFSKFSVFSCINKLKINYPNIKIIITQSFHKSLPSLRQASVIHVSANDEIIKKINESKFKILTTSPSYPIIASIDLACAEMRINGKNLINKALTKVEEIIKYIRNLHNLSINLEQNLEYWKIDALKLSVNFSMTNKSVQEVKDIFIRNNLFVSRFSKNSFLLNFHIGVSESAIILLKAALSEIDDCTVTRESEIPNKISTEYIIPYPPGVPIILPGDQITPSKLQEIQDLKNNGIEIFRIQRKEDINA
ncbi:MAG: hypothetical protein LBI43_06350 [Streptococcaceae bacterium]|jgi:arginine/lysine/ornithine decarboxylase|nr:hypothetical protein [Streptococcaceae bacterium]